MQAVTKRKLEGTHFTLNKTLVKIKCAISVCLKISKLQRHPVSFFLPNSSDQISQPEQDLTAIDIAAFLLGNRYIIICGMIFGILLAVSYIFLTPARFEATLQIEMAKFGGTVNATEMRSTGSPIEAPSLLLKRLAVPTTYPPASIAACELPESPAGAERLAKSTRGKAVPGSESVIEITIHGSSPRTAHECANSIFTMIEEQHTALAKPHIRATADAIKVLQERLNKNHSLMETSAREEMQTAVYLSRRDESLWLLEEIQRMERSIKNVMPTRLVSPIYSNLTPVAPKKTLSIVIGLLAGMFIGLFFAFAITVLKQLRNPPQNSSTALA